MDIPDYAERLRELPKVDAAQKKELARAEKALEAGRDRAEELAALFSEAIEAWHRIWAQYDADYAKWVVIADMIIENQKQLSALESSGDPSKKAALEKQIELLDGKAAALDSRISSHIEMISDDRELNATLLLAKALRKTA